MTMTATPTISTPPEGISAELIALQRDLQWVYLRYKQQTFSASLLAALREEQKALLITYAISQGQHAPVTVDSNNQIRLNLSGLDLRGIDLTLSNGLIDADLTGANLRGALFCSASLKGVRLCGANLSGADLYKTLLLDADFKDARLRGARLDGADMSGTHNIDPQEIAAALSTQGTCFPPTFAPQPKTPPGVGALRRLLESFIPSKP